MSRFSDCQKGFTLIELMVAITIMALLSSFGIASYVNYSRSQSLRTATLDFVTALQLAKASAVSQVKPDTCANTGALEGYQVIKNASDTYIVGPICGGTLDNASSKTKTFLAKDNVTFSTSDLLTITFHTISGDVSFDPASPNDYVDITLEESQSGATKIVRVYTDGRINVQ